MMHSNQCNNMIFYSALNERLTRSQSNPTRRAPGLRGGVRFGTHHERSNQRLLLQLTAEANRHLETIHLNPKDFIERDKIQSTFGFVELATLRKWPHFF